MSLKAIKEALDLLETHIEDNGPCDHSVNICSCGERQTLADAREQIAEMETAAKAYEEVERGGHSPDALESAHRLMLAIAKEAK